MTEAQREGLEYFTKSGKRSDLKSACLHRINAKHDRTDRELAEDLGEEINAITRARYDLVKAGRVREYVKRRCGNTKANAMSWCLGKQTANIDPLSNTELKHIYEMSKRATKEQKFQVCIWFN